MSTAQTLPPTNAVPRIHWRRWIVVSIIARVLLTAYVVGRCLGRSDGREGILTTKALVGVESVDEVLNHMMHRSPKMTLAEAMGVVQYFSLVSLFGPWDAAVAPFALVNEKQKSDMVADLNALREQKGGEIEFRFRAECAIADAEYAFRFSSSFRSGWFHLTSVHYHLLLDRDGHVVGWSKEIVFDGASM